MLLGDEVIKDADSIWNELSGTALEPVMQEEVISGDVHVDGANAVTIPISADGDRPLRRAVVELDQLTEIRKQAATGSAAAIAASRVSAALTPVPLEKSSSLVERGCLGIGSMSW